MLDDLGIELNELVNRLRLKGFVLIDALSDKNFKAASKSGNIMLRQNSILGGAIADCSNFFIHPYLIFQPRTTEQLSIIVQLSTELKAPITFASGKTGLSGGYLNPYVVVDLEHLNAANLNPNSKTNIQLDLENEAVFASQEVTLGELIATVNYRSGGKYLFPTQPSSAFKLPVRLGGAIATNASGVTSGKLGPIKDWILSLRYMTPIGTIEEITPNDPHYDKIIGGMGKYGVILAAKIKLAKVPQQLAYRVCYGKNIQTLLEGLDEIQRRRIFPLVSEFVMGPDHLIGKFQTLASEPSESIRWAILLKGSPSILDEYRATLQNHTRLYFMDLKPHEFQELLEERTAMALMSLPDAENEEYLRFPGFEDVLIPPLQLWEVFERVNTSIKKYGFSAIRIPYGHLNFRKGMGILLHLRLPVKLSVLSKDPLNTKKTIAKAIAGINRLLYDELGLVPKAEHSVGAMGVIFNQERSETVTMEVRDKIRFPDPHVIIFRKLRQQLSIQFPELTPEELQNEVVEALLFGYLWGSFKFDIRKPKKNQ